MSILRVKDIGQTNWIDIPNPKTYQWDILDLDSEVGGTGRGQDGTMHRDRVAIKRKLNLTWPPLNNSEMSILLQSISALFFDLEYPDAFTGGRRISRFYVGNRSAPMYKYDEEKHEWLWESLSANFIEQ